MPCPQGPGLSGVDLCRRIGRDGPRLLLMSGYTEQAPELDEETLPLLAKPFTLAELLQKVQEALVGHRNISSRLAIPAEERQGARIRLVSLVNKFPLCTSKGPPSSGNLSAGGGCRGPIGESRVVIRECR